MVHIQIFTHGSKSKSCCIELLDMYVYGKQRLIYFMTVYKHTQQLNIDSYTVSYIVHLYIRVCMYGVAIPCMYMTT